MLLHLYITAMIRCNILMACGVGCIFILFFECELGCLVDRLFPSIYVNITKNNGHVC